MTLVNINAVLIALAMGAAAAFAILAVLAMAYDRRHPPRIRHGRLPLQPLPPEDSDAMVSRWMDEPGKPDAVDAEIARMLTEGNEHP